MSKIGIFMADGCEEIEGLTVVDIVRRAKMDITMISVNGKREVTSSHGVTFLTDAVAEEVDYDALDGIVLPGGMPGTGGSHLRGTERPRSCWYSGGQTRNLPSGV